MSFVTKDGLWIDGENEHELIMPHAHRSNLNILDDWSGITKEELQKMIEDYLNKNKLEAQ